MTTRALFVIAALGLAALLGPAIAVVGMSDEDAYGGESGAAVLTVAQQAP